MSRFLKKLKFIFISICLVLALGCVVVFGNFTFPNKSKKTPSSTQINSNSSGSVDNEKNKSNATNILLLGDNTDSMMIASIDKNSKNIDITPVKNVSSVDTSNKEKLMNNIQKSTKINVDKFVQVTMTDLMNMVSILGDISVDIKNDDLQSINNLIPKFYAESTDKNKGKMTLLSSPGVQKINEYQAMAYATVISHDVNKEKEFVLSLVENLKNVDFSKYMAVFKEMKPYIKTNLTIPDMIKLAWK